MVWLFSQLHGNIYDIQYLTILDLNGRGRFSALLDTFANYDDYFRPKRWNHLTHLFHPDAYQFLSVIGYERAQIGYKGGGY